MKKLVLLSLILLYSCQSETITFETSDLQVRLPRWLSPCKDLNPTAPYQWKNETEDFYVIINFQDKTTAHKLLDDLGYPANFEGNYTYLINDIKGNFKIKNYAQANLKINQMPATTLQFEGKLAEYDFYYHAAFYDAPEAYYQMTIWTHQNNKAKHQQLMQEMLKRLVIK